MRNNEVSGGGLSEEVTFEVLRLRVIQSCSIHCPSSRITEHYKVKIARLYPL